MITSEDVEEVSDRAHAVPLHPLVGEVELLLDLHPLKGLAGELFEVVLVFAAPFGGSVDGFGDGPRLLLGVGDDDVVEGVEGVFDGRVFFVDQELLFEFELELVLFIGFNFDVRHATVNKGVLFFAGLEFVEGLLHLGFLRPPVPTPDERESLDGDPRSYLDLSLLVEGDEHFFRVHLQPMLSARVPSRCCCKCRACLWGPPGREGRAATARPRCTCTRTLL